MPVDPTLFKDPTLRKEYAPQINEIEAQRRQSEAEAQRIQREQERATLTAAKEAERTQKEIAKQQLTTANIAAEAQYMEAKRPYHKTEDGRIVPKQDDATYAAEQAAKQAQAAQEVKYKQEGRKYTKNSFDGSLIPLESDEAIAARQAADAEKIRQESITQQMQSVAAEAGVRTPALKETDRKQREAELKRAQQDALYALTPKLQSVAKQTDKAGWWDMLNNNPTTPAQAAQARLTRLNQPDATLDDADLADLEADPATLPYAAKIRSLKDQLGADDEARASREQTRQTLAELALRRADPAKWQALQLEKISNLDAPSLQSHLATSNEQLKTRLADFDARKSELEQPALTFKAEEDSLLQQNEQAKQRGIPASELVTLTDGSTWHKPLYAKLAAIDAQRTAWQADAEPRIKALSVDAQEIQRELQVHNASIAAANQRRENEQKQQLAKLSEIPALAGHAAFLQALQQEAGVRRQALDRQYPDGPESSPQAKAAYEALQQDMDAKWTPIQQAMVETDHNIARTVADAYDMVTQAEGRGTDRPQALQHLVDTLKVTPAKAESMLADAEKVDWSRGDEDAHSRVLSDGRLIIRPSLWTDEAAYTQAVVSSTAPQSEKDTALEQFPQRREEAAQAQLEALKTLTAFRTFAEKQPAGMSSVDIVDKFGKTHGWWRTQRDQLLMGMGQGVVGLFQAGVGAYEWMTRDKDAAGLYEKLSTTAGLIGGVTQSLPSGQWTAMAGNLVIGSLPSLAIGGYVGEALAWTGGAALEFAGLIPKAAAPAKGVFTATQVTNLMKGLHITGIAGTAGVQTFGQVYGDAVMGYQRQGFDLKAAQDKATLPAVISGLSTFTLTAIGGLTGTEALARLQTDKLLKKDLKTFLKAVIGGGLREGALEELPDQIIQSIVEKYSYNPDKPMSEIIQEAMIAFFGGAAMGSAFEGLTELDNLSLSASAQQQLPSNTANLPETIAAAETAIDAYAPAGLDEASSARTQATARTLLYIAQGDIESLPDADLALVGVGRGKDGQLENIKTEDGQPPRVKIENGEPLITQTTLDRLEQELPAVRAAIPLGEMDRRQQINQKQSSDANNPETPTPEATVKDSLTVQPAPEAAPVNPANPAILSDQDPAAAERQQQLSTYLQTLGMPTEQADQVAGHLVAKRGVLGEDYLTHVVDPTFRKDLAALGVTGSLQPSESRQNPLKAPADLAQRIQGQDPGQKTPQESVNSPASNAETPVKSKTPETAKADISRVKTFLEENPGASIPTIQRKLVMSYAQVSAAMQALEPAIPADTPGLDMESYMQARQAAIKATPVAARKDALKLLGALDKALTRYAGVFDGVRFSKPAGKGLNLSGGGLELNRDGKGKAFLDVDLGRWLEQHSRLVDKAGVVATTEVEEEFIHRAAVNVFTDADMRGYWNSLPYDLRNKVYQGYHVADIAYDAHKGGKTYPPNLPDKITDMHSLQLGHEFLRMLVQDSAFKGRVSEAVAANPGLGELIIAFLQRLVDELRRLIDQAPADTRITIREYEKRVTNEVNRLRKSLPDPLRVKEQQSDGGTPARNNLATAGDTRASVLSGAAPVPTVRTDFQPVTGSTGTAHTDSNDAIEYEWAVVDVNSLNISNQDDGRINPDYPQDLQPRDRTSAGSEAQVADIAKNMNLDRLSASSGVGDGAPIIGPDGVVESGNGRVMGMRRAHSNDTSASRVYAANLASNAAAYGLTKEQVGKVKNPVLVRVRKTEVDRVAFVLSANVSTIAPKREIEQAKIDSKQIVPDLFESFVPDESGQIFTPANAEFIRSFISAIVPPAERPALIDAKGNLTQTGLRRLRNALFVHAYGDSPESLNALGRLTESLDTSGNNIVTALVAAAPRFAEQKARESAGALYPLSITDDLAQVIQTLQDLRNKGEKVADFLTQDRIPGIGDDPSPIQKALLQFLDANAGKPRQIIETLSRYANAVDAAGDPKQTTLFGDEPRPTRDELWSLASTPARNAPLSKGTVAAPEGSVDKPFRPSLPPNTALKLYRKLKKLEVENRRLLPSQSQALEQAERSLGQLFLFDNARLTRKPAEDLTLESEILRDYINPPEQLRLFSSSKSPDSRINEAFPNWAAGFDRYGLPNPPRILADDHPLLTITKEKKTAALQQDHPLVLEGMLPANQEIPRKVLGRAIVAFFMRQGKPLEAGTSPTVFATGGGGGAGKSTILKILSRLGTINQEGAVTVNADDIKELIPEYEALKQAGDGRAAAVVHEESSQIAKNLLDKLLDPLQPRYNIIYDATLGHAESTTKHFNKWKDAGYRIHLIGVTVNPYEAMVRAVLRGKGSGRWVPSAMLAEAHRGFNANVKTYIDLADAANIYDNTPPSPHEIAEKTSPNQQVMIVNGEYWSILDRRSKDEIKPITLSQSDSFRGSQPGESSAVGDGPPPLREVQSESESTRFPSPTEEGPVTLAAGRKSVRDDGPDLFSFNSGLSLESLLTPAQQEAKTKQAEQLDLFGGLSNARPRSTPQRPSQPARPSRPEKPAEVSQNPGDLFSQPRLATDTRGTGRPLGDLFDSTRQPGSSGASGTDAAGGTAIRGTESDTGPNANPQEGTGNGLSRLPGNAGNPDARPRPDVGTPERNFSVPATIESLAPATDKAKILANVAAIRLLKDLESNQRNATPEEKQQLAAYTGWGAFKEAFNAKYEDDIAKHWDGKPAYQKQYMPDWLQSWERNHRPLHKLLKENMTEDEFASASASTLTSHYTAAPIIRAMWKMVDRLGFKGGRALEPSAGAGHYLGLQPENQADRTQWQTVELDDLTARLLAKLYPESTVNETPGNREAREVTGLGFERARIPNGSLDLIISNVPFHESGPRKKGFPNLNLHNFFFAHALDKVKPGGLVAFITSDSTMQNNQKQREFIASKGDLVAAFRLPNNAFKGNAGTDVTTDIIILRKPDGTPFKSQSWRNLIEVGRQTITLTQSKEQSAEEFRSEAARLGDIVGKEYWKGSTRALDVSAPIMVNEYFVNHPQHALGQHTLAATMYRAGGYALVAPDSLDVSQSLDSLIPALPENVMGQQSTADVKDVVLASRDDKPFSFKEQDGKLYEVQPDGSMEEAEWGTNPALVKTWRSWKRLSEMVESLVSAESSDSFTDEALDRMRRNLNVVYDSHIATHKPVSRRFSNQHKHLYSDPGYPLTSALETEVITVDSKSGKKTYSYKKADIFKKRIGRPIVMPTKAANVNEALDLSLAWKGRIDPVYAAALLGISPTEFEQQAIQRPDIFRNPDSGLLEQGEEYLSGNVRQKLEAAQEALSNDPQFQKNVEALTKAQPERKDISRISPNLGARWIPAPVYQAFIKEVLQGTDTVEYIPAGNSWIISGNGTYMTEEHGTEDVGPAKLFKHALNLTEPMVYYGSGDDRTFAPLATARARMSLDKMKRAFIDFVKTSDTPVEIDGKTLPVWEATEDAFNESQNSYVTPSHTGEYLKFPGLNTAYVYTKPHRRGVIARFLNTRRGMMAHGVGSGKTFNQIILSQEMRRLGLAKKPMIVVQNATLGQFAKSYLKAYPSAKVLVPTKTDFQAQNRRKLVAKIATGDWDAVILPHSQFDLISNKESAVKAYMDSQIDELMDVVTREKDKAKVRDLEGMIKRLKDRRQGMLDALKSRQDTAVMWEDLGIDALIMDEAHNYKSLPIITRMGRVKGVPASSNSQRAINFMLKCRDVQSRTGGKNIFLATGTPIKNSMAEAYIMMQFMAPDILEDFGIHNFDDFATTYGQTVTEAEMSWGGAPKMETRFAKFQNGSALVTMIRTMFDVAFGNEALGLDVPKIKGGEPEMVIIPATPTIDEFNAWTRSVDAAWKAADPKEKEEFTAVPIQTMAAGIAAAVDPRLLAPNAPDHPTSKVNTAVSRILTIYKAGSAKRTTQIVFSDLRNPFSLEYLLPFTGHPFPDVAEGGTFDLYKDIKAKLVAGGVPEKEVHLMQSGMSDVQKSALFEKVDAGEVRIIIGSTELLGVGVNIQTRLKAVHHLMPPRDFTPAMMEQRNGRIIRQGNLHAAKVEGQPAWNEEVEIVNYGTEGSMDSAIYGTLARKQRFITQLLMGEDVQDTFDDPTDPVAVNMAEMAARTLGDPDFIRRIELEKEIKELRLLSEAHTSEIAGKRSRLARTEANIRLGKDSLTSLQRISETYATLWQRKAPRPEGVKEGTDISDKAVYEFGGQTIDTAAKDGAVTNKLDLFLLDTSKGIERRGQVKDTVTLKVNGIPLKVEVHLTLPNMPTGGSILTDQGNDITSFNGAASLIQNLRRLESDAQALAERTRQNIQRDEVSVQNLRANLENAGPFPQTDRLVELEQEAQEVDARLRAKTGVNSPPVNPVNPVENQRSAPLATSTKTAYDAPDGNSNRSFLDPWTSGTSFIRGSRVTPEQGQAIGHAWRSRLRTGLTEPETFDWTPGPALAERLSQAYPGIPTLSPAQFGRLSNLPILGEGMEGTVHADTRAGVVYKIMENTGSTGAGIWNQPGWTSRGRLDWQYQPASRPRHLGLRLALQNLMGGTPTEMVGFSPQGRIILKQPLSPDPAAGQTGNLYATRRASGIVDLPAGMLMEDGYKASIVVVEGRPWLVTDLLPDNYVGDNQGAARINDPIFGQLTPALISKIPGIANVVREAARQASELGDRSLRLFSGTKSLESPEMASNSEAAQSNSASPGGLTVEEAGRISEAKAKRDKLASSYKGSNSREDMSVDEYVEYTDLKTDIFSAIALPDGWKDTDNSAPNTKWGSAYYYFEAPDETFFKVRIGNHAASISRARENEAAFRVPQDASLQDWANAVTRVESWVWTRHQEAYAEEETPDSVSEIGGLSPSLSEGESRQSMYQDEGRSPQGESPHSSESVNNESSRTVSPSALASGTKAAERESLSLPDAISQIESMASDLTDPDYWPEDLQNEAESRLELLDDATVPRPWYPEKRLAQAQRYVEVTARLDQLDNQPEDLTDPESVEYDALTAEQTTLDNQLSAWAASEASKVEVLAPLQDAAESRMKDTIRQIEATGRYRWNLEDQTFDETDPEDTTVLFKSTVAPERSVDTPVRSDSPSPLAKLGWNHLDRALTAKIAAHSRWLNEKTGAGEVAARWLGDPRLKPFQAFAKVLKRELFPDSILPREVTARKREMEIKTALGAQRSMDLVRALSGTPKFSDLAYPPEFSQNPSHRRNLYLAMTGELPMSSLPPAMQALAKKLREHLVSIGREAVKQGRMSADTFAALEEGYMPHYYKEDVQREKSLFQRFRLGIRDILAQRTTAWHIVDHQNKDADGQPRLVSHTRNQWRFRNKEHRDAFFEDFLLQQSLEEITNRNGRQNRNLTLADLRAPAKLPEETRGRLKEINRQLRQRYTKERPLNVAEQEKAGLIMDPVYAIARYTAQMVHDNSTAEFFNFVAANPQWVSQVATPNFTEIPDNPRFGRLAGKHVTDDIAHQLLELVEAPHTALQIYDTLLGWWKTGKTVLNPGTHVRNVLGNIFFSQLAGTSVWNPGNIRYYKDALAALRNGGRDLQEAYEMGVLGADFVSAELRQTLRQLLPDPGTIEDNEKGASLLMGMGKAIGKFIPQALHNPAHKAYNQIAALYQAEDEVFKLAAYLKARAMARAGSAGTPALSEADARAYARDHVRQWFPYFDSGTSGTLKALGRTAMPFLGFYRESIRIFGNGLKERPLALAAGLAVPSLITFLSAMLLGLDDDELDQVKQDMRGKAGKLLGPTPLEGRPLFAMLLPFRSDTGALQQFDISAVHPFVDFLGNRVESGSGEDWWQKTIRSIVAAGPIGSLLYSQMTGRDAFGDRTFVESNMTGLEKIAARTDNAVKTLLPPLFPGGTGFQTLLNAGTRTTGKTLEVRSPTQAVLRAVGGLDVRNATPDLYRIAEDWRKTNKIPTTEGMDFGSTTPTSRARKALFTVLAQDEPNLKAIQNITKKLEEMGAPMRTPQDIQKLLFYKNPLMIIRGQENQARFRASLTGLERQVLEDAMAEYQKIKARAPALIRQAQSQ